MTKAKQYKVTCSNCGNQSSAIIMFSNNSFMSKPSEEEKQRIEEFQNKNGVCPKCGTKNEVTTDLPEENNE